MGWSGVRFTLCLAADKTKYLDLANWPGVLAGFPYRVYADQTLF